MSLISFLRSNVKAPGLDAVDIEKHPYTVERNQPEKVLTSEEAGKLLQSTDRYFWNESKRITPVSGQENQYDVDTYFRVKGHPLITQKAAVACWRGLYWRCTALGTGLLALSGGAWKISRSKVPAVVIIASYAATVGLWILAGIVLRGFITARDQLAVWSHPGKDFAAQRKVAAKLPLEEMIKQKCHFHQQLQKPGTLLGAEILVAFTDLFQRFSEPLLAWKCGKEDFKAQQQWVNRFFNSNPLSIDFFKDNPALQSENGWPRIAEARGCLLNFLREARALGNMIRIVQVQNALEQHATAVAARLSQQNSGIDYNAIKEQFDDWLQLAFVPTITTSRFMWAVKERYALGFNFYGPARHFLERMKDQAPFSNYQARNEALIAEFDVENISDLLRNKAKAAHADANYQQFVDEVFKV
jgi:hypothetical protein